MSGVVLALAALAHGVPLPDAPLLKSYAIPSIDIDGFLVDTPEVAQAKAAHLVELAKASALANPESVSVPVNIEPASDVAVSLPADATVKVIDASVSIEPASIVELAPPVHAPAVFATPGLAPAVFADPARAVALAPPAAFVGPVSAPAFIEPARAVATPVFTDLYSGPAVTPEGFLAETPEVAYQKYIHLLEHARAAYNVANAHYKSTFGL